MTQGDVAAASEYSSTRQHHWHFNKLGPVGLVAGIYAPRSLSHDRAFGMIDSS